MITLQNGVDSVDRLVPILGEEATVAGTTYVVATIAKPGVILIPVRPLESTVAALMDALMRSSPVTWSR